MHRIAIFASGSGSNAENIALYFKDNPQIKIVAIFSDKPDAYVLKRAEKLNIPTYVFTMTDLKDENGVFKELMMLNIDFIVLAGFLRLIPPHIISSYCNCIINIHPALLPKFGGKGMHGMHVHEMVKAAGEKETGITIHYVNEKYDEGAIIFQDKVSVDQNDSPETIAAKVHELEYRHFPKIIEKLLG